MTSTEMVVVGMKHIVCYSGGHSSAIAAVEIVRKYGAENTILLNHDLCSRTEDPDIKRFKQEVSDYLGIPITYANMPGWENKDQFDVCMELKAFKYGIQSSALCTQELKTKPFHKWLAEHYPADPPHIREDVSLVYGFDASEQTRIRRRIGVMAVMGYRTEYPLIWNDRSIYQIEEIGIKRPKSYSIFNHANCIGCLEGGSLLNKYICLDCLTIFDEPKRYIERHGLDTPPYEEFSGCPVCGGSYVPAIYCDGCGEAITGDYARVEAEGKCYCGACFLLKSLGD